MSTVTLSAAARIPAKKTGLLATLPFGVRAFVRILICADLMALACAAWVLISGNGLAPAGIAILIGLNGVSIVLVATTAASLIHAIVEEQRVLRARLSPRSTMRLHASVCERLQWLTLGLLLVPMVVRALLSGHAVGVWAASSAALSGSVALHTLIWLVFVAWRGQLSARWLAASLAALALLLGYGLENTLAVLANHPLAVLVVVPSAYLCAKHLRLALYTPTAQIASEPVAAPRDRVLALLGRLRKSLLTIDGGPVPLVWIWVVFGNQGTLYLITQETSAPATWGSQFDLVSVLFLLVVSAMMSLSLRCDRLHWRFLLAPGHRSRQSIGANVVRRSWTLLIGSLLVMFLFSALIALYQHPLYVARQLPEILLRFGPTLGSELLLCTAMAAWVRPMVSSGPKAFGVFAGVAMLTGVVAFVLYVQKDLHALSWHRGLAHHLGVLLLAGVFILLARRSWARADLRPWQRKAP